MATMVRTIPAAIVAIPPNIMTFGPHPKSFSCFDDLILANIWCFFHLEYLTKYPNYTQIIPQSYHGSQLLLLLNQIQVAMCEGDSS